jgi:hypothetical protein
MIAALLLAGYAALGVAVPDYSIDFDDKADQTVSFAPFLPALGLVSGSAYGFSASASFALEEKDAQSRYESYSFSYFFDWIGVDADYTRVKGLRAAADDTLRADMKVASRDANIWLAPLAANLSLKDFFDPASARRGSGIALAGVVSYDALQLDAAAPLYAGLTSGRFATVTTQLGPAFVLDVFGLYAQGLLTYGTGSQKTRWVADGVAHSGARVAEKMNIFAAFGYKGARFFTQLDLGVDAPTYDLAGMGVTTSRTVMSWQLGVRF